MSRNATQPAGSQKGAPLVQLSPHAVQLLVVPSGTVQPSSGDVQSPQPELQFGAQLPLLQLVPLAFVVPHTTSQPPQLFSSPETSCSQPLKRLVSQSSHRPLQTGLQSL